VGHVAWQEGKLEEARRRFEESLALFVELGEHGPAGGRLTFLGAVAREQGDLAAARRFLERSREHYGRAGDVAGVCGATHSLGDIAPDEGDYSEALAIYGEALDLGEPVGNPRDQAYILAGIASSSAGLGRRAEAGRLRGAVERMAGELDVGITSYDRRAHEQVLGELDAEEITAGAALSNEEALELGRELSRASGS
jgi:tetratricopeptide (TPR) repeat protein